MIQTHSHLQSKNNTQQLSRSPKIVIVTTLPPVNTSLSEYGKFLVQGLLQVSPNAQIDVLADCPTEHGPVKEINLPGLTVHRCWETNRLNTARILMTKIKELQPDVVIFNLQFATFGNAKIPAMLALSTILQAKLAGFKVITVLHNLIEALVLDEPYFAKNALDKALIQIGGNIATRLLLQSDKVVVTLERYREILEEKYQAKNIDVIGLGTYIEPAKEVTVQRKNTFLTFGKFGAYKKLDFLLEAFDELSQEYPDLELKIGGTDHPNHVGYLQHIQHQYAHLNNVKFLGWIEDDELPALINQCKAMILSYESTAGSSGPLHLALSQGKPVVTPDIGDFINVANNENVELLFYSHRDLNAFKSQMRALIEGRIDLEQIGQHNLNIAHQFSAENTARSYAQLIAEITDWLFFIITIK